MHLRLNRIAPPGSSLLSPPGKSKVRQNNAKSRRKGINRIP